MAAAAHKIQLIVTDKVPELQTGRSLYIGTAEGGTGYETGGVGLEEEATLSRYKLPARIDYIFINALLPSQWVKTTQLCKLLAANTVTAKKSGLVEYETGETMATLVPAGSPFWAIGLS
jgi:hypothetical protein